MTHACACCSLRFANASELAYHVREDHSEQRPFEEHLDTIHLDHRPPWPHAPRPVTAPLRDEAEAPA